MGKTLPSAEKISKHTDKCRLSPMLQKLAASVIQVLCKCLTYKNVFSAIWGGWWWWCWCWP